MSPQSTYQHSYYTADLVYPSGNVMYPAELSIEDVQITSTHDSTGHQADLTREQGYLTNGNTTGLYTPANSQATSPLRRLYTPYGGGYPPPSPGLSSQRYSNVMAAEERLRLGLPRFEYQQQQIVCYNYEQQADYVSLWEKPIENDKNSLHEKDPFLEINSALEDGSQITENAQTPPTHLPTEEQNSDPKVPTRPNIAFLKKYFYRKARLTVEQALHIIEEGTKVLKQEPNILEMDAPITVSGDVHGQDYDLMKLFEVGGDPPETKYPFQGDYVDRGDHSTKSYEAARRFDPFDELEMAHKYRKAAQVKGFSGSRRTWRHGDPYPNISQGVLKENRRKVLRVTMRGKEHVSCPDSGSSENIMSEDFAHNEGFRVRRSGKDLKMFQLGSGKFVWSIGKVKASVLVPGLPLVRKKQSFFVLPNCPVPLIMGLAFLQEAEIMSKNRHILESCPAEWKSISNLLWIGSPRPRNRMRCSLDGRDLTGVADTGSDLNLISLECAKREGFDIDRRETSRRRIKFGDRTEAETLGQVYVYDLGFYWSQPETEPRETTSSSSEYSLPTAGQDIPQDNPHKDNYEIFHVLPGLPSDLIFGRDLLERLDAFNYCPDLLVDEHPKEHEPHIPELNVLIDMGGLSFSFWRRRKNKKRIPTPHDEREQHDDDWHAELGRRSRIEDEISLLPQREQAQARSVERRKARIWDHLHAHCIHCNPVN